jgi:two-component system NtrC family sensor kinase
MSALGQVISGVAHELNNPLAAIKGYTDLLLLTSQIDEQTRSALMKVSLESNRAARLVHDLLAFARPETPKMEPVNVNEVIRKFSDQRLSELEAKDIALDLDLGDECDLVLASADQLQQVLAHLTNNAVDALEEVDGQRVITVSSRLVDSKIQIRVEDSGPGIDPDVLPRIFEPFFTTKPVGTGTGLGLSVCYSIMLQHKGKITYLPSFLGGACFVVEFSAAFGSLNASTSNIATAEFRPRAAGRVARLLVVDDEPTVCALLNDMLTLLGHQIKVHSSPYDALAELEQNDFDAVLSDFRMPGLTGGELYERAIALDAKYRDRFIFLTGDMMDPQTHAFFASQKVQCILKPFQLSALQSALAGVLERGEPSSTTAIPA